MSNVLSALQHIDVAAVSYQEWVNIGMALKAEGYDWTVWDDWSRNDPRYHSGECQRKWSTFRGSATPITGGTIVQMAKEYGWSPIGQGAALDWNDTIMDDGDSFNQYAAPDTWNPTQELITYLETLYDKDDFVGYVTNDVWQDNEGRWVPAKGVFNRTAGELIASLRKHPNDVGATIGDWKPDVGAWIRFNPVDGEGVKNDKSFALMELCVAIAEGKPWLGFSCKKGRVLYVNLEIDPASCINRFIKIYDALGYKQKNADNIVIWNLRGYAVPLDKLVPKLIRRVRDQHFDAIIVDPIYKVITGDENNASDMAAFCNQFDKICTETGCATIYCHHHSKGAQGAKRAMDRASGSGVFARDPDAQLDMIQLELTEDQMNNLRDGNATAWRLESSLREFENIRPVNFWFEYPIHRVDTSGELDVAHAEGSFEAARSKNKKYTTADERRESLETAYQACLFNPPVTLTSMAEYLDITERCVRDRIKESGDIFSVKKGIVTRTKAD